jgi:hypothetical protein
MSAINTKMRKHVNFFEFRDVVIFDDSHFLVDPNDLWWSIAELHEVKQTLIIKYKNIIRCNSHLNNKDLTYILTELN